MKEEEHFLVRKFGHHRAMTLYQWYYNTKGLLPAAVVLTLILGLYLFFALDADYEVKGREIADVLFVTSVATEHGNIITTFGVKLPDGSANQVRTRDNILVAATVKKACIETRKRQLFSRVTVHLVPMKRCE